MTSYCNIQYLVWWMGMDSKLIFATLYTLQSSGYTLSVRYIFNLHYPAYKSTGFDRRACHHKEKKSYYLTGLLVVIHQTNSRIKMCGNSTIMNWYTMKLYTVNIYLRERVSLDGYSWYLTCIWFKLLDKCRNYPIVATLYLWLCVLSKSLRRTLKWNCALAQFCKVLIFSKRILHCFEGESGNLAFIR